MIPILYSPYTPDFNTNGSGGLSDAISCNVVEERNSIFELEMVYPITGIHYSDIEVLCIILAKPNPYSNPQGFRIYKITKPLNGRVNIYAEHISYQLNHIPVMPFTGTIKTASQLYNLYKLNSLEYNPFTFSSSVSLERSRLVKMTVPNSMRSCFGGIEGSMLDIFHGEYEFDNYQVKLHEIRGKVSDAILRYGKDIIDITQEENIENTITGICPYWKGTDAEGTEEIVLVGPVVQSEYADNFPYHRTIVYDFSSYFEDKPTSDQLSKAAQDYIADNKVGVPKVSIDLSLVDLRRTTEYTNIVGFDELHLCDYVRVEFELLGISTTAQIVKTEYDVLIDTYTNLTIGDSTSKLADTIKSYISDSSNKK